MFLHHLFKFGHSVQNIYGSSCYKGFKIQLIPSSHDYKYNHDKKKTVQNTATKPQAAGRCCHAISSKNRLITSGLICVLEANMIQAMHFPIAVHLGELGKNAYRNTVYYIEKPQLGMTLQRDCATIWFDLGARCRIRFHALKINCQRM